MRKLLTLATFAIAAASLGSTVARAETGPLTREQVMAETADYLHHSTLVRDDNGEVEHGVPASQAESGLSRDEVKRETAQAARDGMIVRDDSGEFQRQEFAGQYPAARPTQGKTRAEVKAELAQAMENQGYTREDNDELMRSGFAGH